MTRKCIVCSKPLPLKSHASKKYHVGKCALIKKAEKARRFYWKHREKLINKFREHYRSNKKWWRTYNKKYRKKNPAKVRKWLLNSYKKRKEKWLKMNEEQRQSVREYFRNRDRIIRYEVIAHYGDKCACCGETRKEFLCIDHIHGGGEKHRKKLGITAGARFCSWIKRNKFPKEFQILCWNCNQSKGSFKYCPHEREKQC